MKKLGIVLISIATVALLAGSVCSLLLSQKLYKDVKDVQAYVNEQRKAAEPQETTENNVTIASEYKIKDTNAIEEAYKSGDTSSLDDKQKETLDMAKGIIEEVIKDDMTPYDKEKAIYDWMCKNLARDAGLLTVIPSTNADCDNPYGVLKYHNAVCVGYATTFRMFMHMLDIECMVIHNTECYHSWDLVKLDDKWYHTDIYGDVGNGNYAHFNMPDAMRSREQNWDTSFFPAANGLKYNVAMKNKKDVANVFELPAKIVEGMKDRQGSMFFKFTCEVDEEFAQKAVRVCQMVDEYVMNNWDSLRCYIGQYNFFPDEENGGFILWVTASYNNDSYDNNALSDEENQKIDEMINELFANFQYAETNNDTTNNQ